MTLKRISKSVVAIGLVALFTTTLLQMTLKRISKSVVAIGLVALFTTGHSKRGCEKAYGA